MTLPAKLDVLFLRQQASIGHAVGFASAIERIGDTINDTIESVAAIPTGGGLYVNVADYMTPVSGVPTDAVMATNLTGLNVAMGRIISGGTLFFPAGRWPIKRTAGRPYCLMILNGENVRLLGDAGAVLCVAGDMGCSDTNLIQLVNCNGVTFENMGFSQRDCSKVNQQNHQVQIGGSSEPHLALRKNDNVQFVRCTFKEGVVGSGDGVRILGGDINNKQTRIVFDRCVFDNVTRSGISVQRGSWDINVMNCFFKTGGSLQGIHFEPSGVVDTGRWRIIGNHFDTCQASLVGTNTTLPDQQSIFAYNTIYNSTFLGSYLNGAIIAYNHIYGDAPFGTDPSLCIQQSCADVQVVGNYIYRGVACNSSPTVLIEVHNGLQPTRITYVGNVVNQYTNNSMLEIDSASRISVTGNKHEFHGTATNVSGVYIKSSAYASGVYFCNNLVESSLQADGVTPAGLLTSLVNIEESLEPLTFPSFTFTATNATETFNKVSHGRSTGDGPIQVSSSGTLPAGLSPATNYWIISTGANTFKLATSLLNANLGTNLLISDDGIGTHTLAAAPKTKTRLVLPILVQGNRGTRVVVGLRDQNAPEVHRVIPIVAQNQMDASCTDLIGGADNALTYWSSSGTPGFEGLMTGTVTPASNVTAKQGQLYVWQNGNSSSLWFKATATDASGWVQVVVP